MGTTMGYGSSFTEQMWRPGVTLEAVRSTNLMRFAGSDEYDAFQMLDKPGNGRGDQVTMRFSRPGDRDPKTSTSQILGQEASTEYLEDSLYMRYFALDGAIENVPADQNNVSFDLVANENSRIAREWAYLWEQWIINQLVGNTATAVTGAADYGRSGGNATVAPDANHWYYCPDTAENANEAAVAADAASVMTTDVIDELVTRSTSKAYVKWPMAPCNTPYGDLYVLVVHGRGYKQIRENSTATDFYDIEKAKIQGGNSIAENSLIHGEGFIYNKTLVLRSDFCPAVIANARRAAFFGAKAGHFIFGEGYTDGDHLGYSQVRHHRRLSIVEDTISGFKVTIPQETDTSNNERFGCYVVSHYSDV